MSPLLFIFAFFWATALPDLYLPNNDTKMKTNANDENKATPSFTSAEMNELMDGLEPKKKPERRQFRADLYAITAPQLFAYGTSQGLWDLRYPFIAWKNWVKGGEFSDGYTDYEIYLVRVYYGKEILPGHVQRNSYNSHDCFAMLNNRQVNCNNLTYEYLYKHPEYTWAKRKDGKLANGIVESGIIETYANIYHCTFLFDAYGYKGELVGSIFPTTRNCVTIFAGHEMSSREYWVLKDGRFA